jgi:excisionase family DNA binding protein
MAHTALLTEHQAADRLSVKVKTLQAWRVRGGGPKFVKVGRLVRYTEEALQEFICRRTMAHTSDLHPFIAAEVQPAQTRDADAPIRH